jgi:squalene synthase HpnC
MLSIDSDQAQELCRKLTRDHYENFPVASWLLPSSLRQPIAAIYAFARSADDFADEHDLDDSTRLALLDTYSENLDRLQRGEQVQSPIFIALSQTIRDHRLPFQPLYDLLAAFRQDVEKKRYADFNEVLAYCRKSANPVGRLLLHLFKRENEQNTAYADAICTALQLINFLQDIQVDILKNRIYLPQDEMAYFGATETHIRMGSFDAAWQALIAKQIERIHAIMQVGSPLLAELKGGIGLEIRMTVAGGLGILKKLRRQNDLGFIQRPRLNAWDWVKLFLNINTLLAQKKA